MAGSPLVCDHNQLKGLSSFPNIPRQGRPMADRARRPHLVGIHRVHAALVACAVRLNHSKTWSKVVSEHKSLFCCVAQSHICPATLAMAVFDLAQAAQDPQHQVRRLDTTRRQVAGVATFRNARATRLRLHEATHVSKRSTEKQSRHGFSACPCRISGQQRCMRRLRRLWRKMTSPKLVANFDRLIRRTHR